jgi:hypothetical protein
MIIQDFLARLKEVKPGLNGSWKARCPAHLDKNPSLTITVRARDNAILAHCHGGCEKQAVLDAMGLRMSDLFADNGSTPAKRPDRPQPRQESKRRIVEGYDYTDEAGALLFQAVRYEPKDFRQRRPDGKGGWIHTLDDTRRVVYRLPELLKAVEAGREIWIVEGEKDVDYLNTLGLAATCNPMGAGKWTADYNGFFKGATVRIVPDNDKPGREHVAMVAAALAPVAADVRIVELPGLDEKGDIADWIDAGHTVAELNALAEAAPLIGTMVQIKPADESQTESPTRFEPFPVEILPAGVSCFVDAASRAIGCDPSFVALPVLSVLAAAIGNTRRVELKPGWTEPPILWTAIVGESGEKKTPAFRVAMKALRAIQATRIQEYKAAKEDHEEDLLRYDVALRKWKGKGEGTPPGKPIEPEAERLIVSDTTVEALAPMLESNPRGLLLARDELDGWFGSFNRYANGNADAAHWLSMFNAETVMVDRKTGQQTYFVPSACLSISGGIQPGILARALHDRNRENGIAARFLFTMPPRKAKRWTEAEIPAKDEAALAGIVERLHGIEPEQDEEDNSRPGILPLTQDAKGAFIAFYNEHAAELADLSGDLAAAFAKLEAYVARLALVFQLTREPAAAVVDAESMQAGIVLVRWFAGEARRVYSMLSETDEDRAARELEQWIERKGGSVTARETVQCHRHRFASTDEAEAALETLAKRGCGRWVDVPPGPKGGRPTRRLELSTQLNPPKHEQE